MAYGFPALTETGKGPEDHKNRYGEKDRKRLSSVKRKFKVFRALFVERKRLY